MTAFAIGVVALLFAIGLFQLQRETWRNKVTDAAAPIADKDLKFLRGQRIRRTIVNAMILLLGILFIVDSYVEHLLTSVILISAILILLLGIFAVAILEFYLTHRHLHPHVHGTVSAKQALLQEADRLMIARHVAEMKIAEVQPAGSETEQDGAKESESAESTED